MSSFRTKLRTEKVLQGPFPPSLSSNPWKDLPSTPQSTFKTWYQDAINANIHEPHTMTLSTIDEEGNPDARVLILKNVDERGWHFATKADSPKGRHLSRNGRAALTFYWSELGRQVRVKGPAVVLGDEECRVDFLGRGVQARVCAVASRQSEVLGDWNELERRVDEMRGVLEKDGSFGVEGWRVYVVEPVEVEFWQGDERRLHRRVRYIRREKGEEKEEDGGWEKQMLWP